MTEAVSLDEVMTRRFQLVEEQAILAGKQKAEMAPLAEEVDLCEKYIKGVMLESGLQQVKTDAGMTFFTSKDSVAMRDFEGFVRFILQQVPPLEDMGKVVPDAQWKRVIDHIAEHGMWALLTKAANKTVVKELIEAGTPPTGIEFSSYRDLAWRKGKS